MRLCSIFNVWGDTLNLLPHTIKNHLSFSDGVIVVWSTNSNKGERDDRMMEFVATHSYDRVLFHQMEPTKGSALMNETRKRNRGLEVAKAEGYTHYLISDGDEFYLPQEIAKDKELFADPGLVGLVSRIQVYIKSPTLWVKDSTLLPTIHKLNSKTYVGNFPQYPYAYEQSGSACIDASRRPNELSGIIMSDTICHHYSYLRADMSKKINNSTAHLKRRETDILSDMRNAKAGGISAMYGKRIYESENLFNL